ncbi:MAG: hypothetical protein NC182_06205 [Prevotella sp.]|nr:hypothetical protein [Staphylococcus sp.]MCM1350777.1 hypothetical protein [Prevotella sp.]
MKHTTKRIYICGSVLAAIGICIIIFLMSVWSLRSHIPFASTEGTYQITVNQVSTVTIYVSGPGVTWESSTKEKEIYQVKPGTSVTFRAINESKLFTKWKSNDATINGSTETICTMIPTKDMEVSVDRRDPVAKDRGCYISNAFSIQAALDLQRLQQMFNAGSNLSQIDDEVISAYDHFFQADEVYRAFTFEEKKKAIQQEYFSKIQKGYFKVEESFLLFEKDYTFTGIGNNTYPFQGVVCGANGSDSQFISLVIRDTEHTGDNYYGLFGVLGEQAVIRNLKIQTSVTISKATNEVAHHLYIGGLAGTIENALLRNLEIIPYVSIHITGGTSSNMTQLYVGGLAGQIEGGIDDKSGVICNGNTSNWMLEIDQPYANMYVGLMSGRLENTYIKEIDLKISEFGMYIQYIDKGAQYKNPTLNTYMGNLCGQFIATSPMCIEDVRLTGNKGETIFTLVDFGNAYTAGLIGYIQTTALLEIGHIRFEMTDKNKTSYIRAASQSNQSQTNLYTAGLFAYVEGNQLKATSGFKEGIIEKKVDDKIYHQYNYIFNGNIEIESKQSGQGGNSYGKAVAAGLVAKGLFDINGTTDYFSNILLSPKEYQLHVKATKTSLASTQGENLIEHCIASLVFGLTHHEYQKYSYEYINVYTHSSKAISTRELSSRTYGDMHTAGFMGYSNGTNYHYINLYLNDCDIEGMSLSYESEYKAEGNNVFVGGCIGEFVGDALQLAQMNHVVVSGFDDEKGVEIGTTSKIISTQNVIPGGGDYRGENYVGGVIGRMYCGNVYDTKYQGSKTNQDYIQMRGHQSPDSAFVGGLIGFIKNNAGGKAIVNNCEVADASVYGATTNRLNYDNPDMYVGGMIGAIYIHDNINGGLSSDGCRVYRTEVEGRGNDRIEVYIGGMIAGITWSGSSHISNCYIYDCNISGVVLGSENGNKGWSYVAGIVPNCYSGSKTTISQSVVIDTILKADSNQSIATTHGIAGSYANNDLTIENCYSNATLEGTGHTTNRYGLSNDATATTSYYVIQQAKGSYGEGIGLDFTDKEIQKDGTDLFPSMNAQNKIANKYHIHLYKEGRFTVAEQKSNGYNILTVNLSKQSNITNIASIWINAKKDGSNDTVDVSATDEINYQNGWFKLGDVIIYNGKTEMSGQIEDTEISYLDGENTYQYSIENDCFQSTSYPYHTVENIGYKEMDSNQSITIGTNQINIFKTIQIFVRDDMPDLKIQFTIINQRDDEKASSLWPVFYDEQKNDISSEISLNNYGSYQAHSHVSLIASNYEFITYQFVFEPNGKIESNQHFYLGFKIINTDEKLASIFFEIELIHNAKTIQSVQHASYTPPIGYKDETIDGSLEHPYLIRAGSIIKFIPIFTKQNDLPVNGKLPEYSEELNVNQVDYVLSDTSIGIIKPNGELVTQSTVVSNQVYYFDVTLRENKSQTKRIYFRIVTGKSVSYNLTGAVAEGLLYATDQTDYVLSSTCLEQYGGIPNEFWIRIGNTLYELKSKDSNTVNSAYQWLYDENGLPITTWDLEQSFYELRIPKAYITDEIFIQIEFLPVYTISFYLQNDDFASDHTYPQAKKYKIGSGTYFQDFFEDKLDELYQWRQNATIEGYRFSGFYLVDNANSEESYGMNFEELLDWNLEIASSYVFYARWNFLIELIEAPGTYIHTVFTDSFMHDIGKDENGITLPPEELEKLGLRKAISVPIHHKQGYAFTIDTDPDFIGDTSINAYIVKHEAEELVVTEIEIHQESNQVYRIFPEQIQGYLVITTSVGHSNVIVGEHTDPIMDNMLPEDGIYTFKYIVNHQNKTSDQSYIYNSGKDLTNPNASENKSNLYIEKNILLEFYTQIYNQTTKQMDVIPRYLPQYTHIDVYYNRYVNGSITPTRITVGQYDVTDREGITKLLLSEFQTLDGSTSAFEPETFEKMLGTNETVSEVYYFVITPPNGYDTNTGEYGKIVNQITYGGYYDTIEDDYIKGIRSNGSIANIPLEDAFTQTLQFETAKQVGIYSVMPSRKTVLKQQDSNTYTFTDQQKCSLLDITLMDGAFLYENGVGMFQLFDEEHRNTILESSQLEVGILEIKLTLGYGKGKVNIYGKQEEGDWEWVDIIDVDDYEYQEYSVSFDMGKHYQYFRIDNASLNEIRCKNIYYKGSLYGMEYIINTQSRELVEEKINDNITKYRVYRDIVGDMRHEGKHFILAVQYKKNNQIVENLLPSSIRINDTSYFALDGDKSGRNIAYFDLTDILYSEMSLAKNDLLSITFTLEHPVEYAIYAVELLEVSLPQKPAMSEVRYVYRIDE